MEKSRESLDKIMYRFCLLTILIIGLFTEPLVVFLIGIAFGYWYITSKDGCSLTEAKKLLKKVNRYKTTRKWFLDTAINKPQWSEDMLESYPSSTDKI